MRANTINLQIVVNLGNYETIRLGAEWTPSDNQPLADAFAQAQEELKDAARIMIAQRNNPTAAEKAAEEQAAAEARTAAEKAAAERAMEEKAAAEKTESEQAAAAEKAAEKDYKKEDTRELLPADSRKFAKVIKRLEAGVDYRTICQYFRFDTEGERIINKIVEQINK